MSGAADAPETLCSTQAPDTSTGSPLAANCFPAICESQLQRHRTDRLRRQRAHEVHVRPPPWRLLVRPSGTESTTAILAQRNNKPPRRPAGDAGSRDTENQVEGLARPQPETAQRPTVVGHGHALVAGTEQRDAVKDHGGMTVVGESHIPERYRPTQARGSAVRTCRSRRGSPKRAAAKRAACGRPTTATPAQSGH